jgi:hypothetical protein
VTSDQAAVARIRGTFDRVVAAGYRPETVEGAPDDEIDAWASALRARSVPPAKREVMRKLGRQCGAWMSGLVFGVTTADPEVVARARWCLEEADERGLPHGMRDPAGLLLIADHDPEAYTVIDGSDLADPDPPVWLLLETGEVRKALDSVTRWFAVLGEEVVDMKRRLVARRARGRPDPLREPCFRW